MCRERGLGGFSGAGVNSRSHPSWLHDLGPLTVLLGPQSSNPSFASQCVIVLILRE